MSPMAGVTSLKRLNFGDVMADGKGRAMVRGLMAEIERLARGRGDCPPGGQRGAGNRDGRRVSPGEQIVIAARL